VIDLECDSVAIDKPDLTGKTDMQDFTEPEGDK
jgi:hypothetical protein